MDQSAAPEAFGVRAPVLEVREIQKRFGDRLALRGVSLTASSGELVAVIGPNGAGKTTLLSIVAGTLPPDGGEIVTAPDRIGWVPQQQSLYGKLTVEENLRLFARLERCEEIDETVARMLEQTHLADRADDQAGTLSGGNRQRLNVAIGLLGDPELLLLDEPSASLDPRQRGRLWEFVNALAAEGTTIVFTTHDVQEADRHATQLVVLADGERLFDGSPAELRGVAEGDDFESAFVTFLAGKGH
jgi:ABC-2 type transport system ATP-binding protein